MGETPLISVLIPTIEERHELRAQTIAGYVREGKRLGGLVEILTTSLYTWGGGCNQLALRAKGEFLLLAPDDLVPHEGCLRAGLAMLAEGSIPFARYLTVEGAPLHPDYDAAPHGRLLDWTRVFLIPAALHRELGPLIDATWLTDIDYSGRLLAAGREIRSCEGFAFTHLDGSRAWRTAEIAAAEEAAHEASRRRRAGSV